VVEDLGHGARAARPDPGLRDRVLTSVREAARTGMVIRPEDGGWERGDVPGVSVKRLFGDPPTGRLTMLVRMAARARWAVREARARHELFVLEGGLALGGVAIAAGDGARAGDIDGVADGDGCTLVLLRSPIDPDAAVPTSVVLASEREWRPGGTSGVLMKRLLADPALGTVTALVRMVAGATLPPHRHVTAEQFYVLTGDAHVSGHDLEAGAFYAAGAGTVHDVTHTRGGCEFLLIASAVTFEGDLGATG
jgi:quercetin dioxygenase-like cupin family protein